jgi:hypothetical protein
MDAGGGGGQPDTGGGGGGGDDAGTVEAGGDDATGDDASGDDSGGSMPEAGTPPDATATPTFTSVYAIFKAHCLPCHSTGNGKTKGKLDLSSQANAYKALVGVKSTGSSCGTSAATRVVAGMSAMSLLYEKLNPKPPCGMQMPENATALGASDLAQIAAWIDDGAKND